LGIGFDHFWKNTTIIEHFCALTRPSDEAWPFDLTKALEKHNKTAAKVDKMDSERALLGFLLAKIGKIDPDIIIGHDVFGFDTEVNSLPCREPTTQMR